MLAMMCDDDACAERLNTRTIHRRVWGRAAATAAAVMMVLATGAVPVSAKTTAPVRIFKLEGPVAEVKNPWNIFGLDNTQVMADLVEALKVQSKDKATKTIVLRVRGLGVGFAQGAEISDAIAAIRKAGRKVIVHAESLSGVTAMAVLGADQVVMSPEGTLLLPGLRAEVAYFKDVLDSVGLSADFVAIGKYKSAAEPMTRTTMSPAAREALEALVDDLYQEMVSRVASSRRLKPAVVKGLIDTGLFHADDAKKAGLVDTLMTWDALYKKLKRKSGSKAPPALVYPALEPMADFSSIFSLLSLLTKKPDDSNGTAGSVALLTLEGAIVSGTGSPDPFESESRIASRDVVRTLRRIRADKRVKALVVRINSPGGSALASDVIWQELASVKSAIPVVVSMGNYAASGGYYIASAAHQIIAEPATITGSIGVFGGKLVLGGALQKVGVKTVVIQRGKNAGLFSSMAPFTDGERATLTRHMQRTYDTFINRVAKGRGMSYDAVHKVAQGRVWSGVDAKAMGLVDRLGGLQTAIDLAGKRAKIDPARVKTIRFPQEKSLMEMLQDDKAELSLDRLFSGVFDRWLGRTMAKVAGPLFKQARTVYEIVGAEVVATMLPFSLRVR